MKRIVCGILAAGVLLLGGVYPAEAWRGGGSQHGGSQHGGFQHEGFRHGGHPHVFVGGRVFIGAPFWWDPWYPYPAYSSPPVIVQQAPPADIEQSAPGQATAYWYYCEQAKAYYPYVKECPSGWMTVVPPPASPGQ